MSAICEVTELGFPKTKGVRVSLSIPIFKSKHCKLRKMGAGCNELPDLISRANSLFDWAVVAILVLVEDMSVSMWKSSALNVLSRQAYMIALVNQWWKSQRFSSSPIDSLSILNGFLAGLEYLNNLRVELAALFRKLGDLHASFFEFVELNACIVKVVAVPSALVF